jgi:hypothetical protein
MDIDRSIAGDYGVCSDLKRKSLPISNTTLDTLKRLCQDDKEVSQLLAGTVEPLTQNGAIGNGRSSPDNIMPTQYGTSTDYLTARIARDRPDILERMKTGAYKSVRAAAIDAGIVKQRRAG